MARSHHRKKHKEHLRQYQHNQEGGVANSRKGKVSGTIAAVGIILGIAVGYFASDGNITWIAAGAVVGGIAGYLTGRYFDKEPNK